MIHRLLTIALLLAMAGCKIDSTPEVLAGRTYRLVSIDQRPLPTTADGTSQSTMYTDGELAFGDDSRVNYRYTTTVNGSAHTQQLSGSFSLVGDALTIVLDAAPGVQNSGLVESDRASLFVEFPQTIGSSATAIFVFQLR